MTTAATARAAPMLRRLGLSGAVLFAALLCDLLIIASAVLDRMGDPAKDLVLLPGIVAMTACALWGRAHAVRAATTAAAVLAASTALISSLDVAAYSTLLSNVSFAETVAGVELVYFCARRARVAFASAASALLVGACVTAAIGRDHSYGSTDLVQTVLFGLLLLVGALVVAVAQRRPRVVARQRPASRRRRAQGVAAELVRTQWPLIGLLALPLFTEVYTAAEVGVLPVQVLLCSVVASVLAVLATRAPAWSGATLAATLLVSGVLGYLPSTSPEYPLLPGPSLGRIAGGIATPLNYVAGTTGLPLSQITAGMTMVVLLVRSARPVVARNIIVLLAVVVTISVLLNFDSNDLTTDPSLLPQLALGALLLLGISVAVGLFLRSRDSERTQLVRSARSDAQTSERMALARELHDVVAHHVTGMVVQAQAARMVGSTDARTSTEAFETIETSGTEALAAMRRLVGSMRDEQAGEHEQAGERASIDLDADLRALERQVGEDVRVRFELDIPSDVPQEIARSVLRVTQEALTNVGKHAADATLITVSAGLVDDALRVRVIDNGSGTHTDPAGGSGGYGLVGMRERVELLGGALTTGRQADGGWHVALHLPVEATT